MTRVIVVLFDRATTLDVTGPAEVFAAARSGERPRYRLLFASTGGGLRVTTSSLQMQTRDLLRIRPEAEDIVVVAGGDEPGIRAAAADGALLKWLARAARTVRCIASVCSGAFLLALAGVLEGKRATTHWRACAQLSEMFPQITVDTASIFVRDGKVWTSAGVTTGIDMALAIVELDLGRAAVDALAAELVLYVRRPGFQAQFSTTLVTQASGSLELTSALEWLRNHLDRADIELFAKRAGMSLRTLHRRCLEQFGTTPAKLIAKLRIEQARALLTTTRLSAKLLAARCGFGNTARMTRTFQRELGVGPREYRLLHSP
jgi:transcriptional regulator GlxA family with amidase domain